MSVLLSVNRQAYFEITVDKYDTTVYTVYIQYCEGRQIFETVNQ